MLEREAKIWWKICTEVWDLKSTFKMYMSNYIFKRKTILIINMTQTKNLIVRSLLILIIVISKANYSPKDSKIFDYEVINYQPFWNYHNCFGQRVSDEGRIIQILAKLHEYKT